MTEPADRAVLLLQKVSELHLESRAIVQQLEAVPDGESSADAADRIAYTESSSRALAATRLAGESDSCNVGSDTRVRIPGEDMVASGRAGRVRRGHKGSLIA